MIEMWKALLADAVGNVINRLRRERDTAREDREDLIRQRDGLIRRLAGRKKRS